MSEKRFSLDMDTEWWFVDDNAIQVNEFGYRDDLTGEDKYKGLKQTLTEQETVDLLNELHEENQQYKALLQDMGIILSDDETKNIRNEIADKIIKPLYKSCGFDVDVDTDVGFTIIPNNQDLKEWIDKQKELKND